MSILTRTYPFKQSAHWLRDSAVYGVVIWAILYFLQPFGISLYTGNKCLFAAAFGVVTAVCYASYGCAISMLLHPLVTSWRIWHQCCAVFGLILFIALCNLFLFSSITHCSITAATFLLFLYWTLVIGVILTALSVGIDYNRSLRERMEELLNKTTEEQSDITITICGATVRGNDLTIPINNLLYIEAQKNNVSVCFVKDNVPTHHADSRDCRVERLRQRVSVSSLVCCKCKQHHFRARKLQWLPADARYMHSHRTRFAVVCPSFKVFYLLVNRP